MIFSVHYMNSIGFQGVWARPAFWVKYIISVSKRFKYPGLIYINIIHLGQYWSKIIRLYSRNNKVYDVLTNLPLSTQDIFVCRPWYWTRFQTNCSRLILRFRAHFEDFGNWWNRPDLTKVLEYMVAVRPLG